MGPYSLLTCRLFRFIYLRPLCQSLWNVGNVKFQPNRESLSNWEKAQCHNSKGCITPSDQQSNQRPSAHLSLLLRHGTQIFKPKRTSEIDDYNDSIILFVRCGLRPIYNFRICYPPPNKWTRARPPQSLYPDQPGLHELTEEIVNEA